MQIFLPGVETAVQASSGIFSAQHGAPVLGYGAKEWSEDEVSSSISSWQDSALSFLSHLQTSILSHDNRFSPGVVGLAVITVSLMSLSIPITNTLIPISTLWISFTGLHSQGIA